ncbi:hypothetical protein ACHQM5_024548 [Ranunculus cassubicifolius]
MGGHGGLNILPQKRWNVYNFDNREKVRKDEEAAAKEEQIKREQSRKRDAEFRLQKLRLAKGIPDPSASTVEVATSSSVETKSNHINLFQGLKVFPSLGGIKEDDEEEATPKVVSAEDEKYRLGYGIAGKGVKVPWYLSKPSTGKKTLEELREERLKREKGEKERELALIRGKNKQMDLSKSKVRHFS